MGCQNNTAMKRLCAYPRGKNGTGNSGRAGANCRIRKGKPGTFYFTPGAAQAPQYRHSSRACSEIDSGKDRAFVTQN